MRLVKRALRRLLPLPVLNAYRRVRYGQTWFDYGDRSTREVFAHIYRNGVWGGSDTGLYSGPGSAPEVTAPYVEAVREFIQSHAIRALVDLGCGDFRVGSLLITPGLSYHGVDIVEDVVRCNQEIHAGLGVTFSCLDAIHDALPVADLCLVREVLQHLSNAEIQKVLGNCRHFRHVIVTEAVAAPERFTAANIDMGHGPFTRADRGSGVVLDAAPFSMPVARTLVETLRPGGIVLRTVVLEQPGHLGAVSGP